MYIYIKKIIEMKKHLLLCLIVCSTTLSAQITINNSHLPIPGQTWINALDEFYTAAVTPGGANQTWNYSALLTTSFDTTVFLNAANTPYGASNFPSSTMAIHQPGDSMYLYLTTGANGLDLDGYYFYSLEPPFGQNAIPFVPANRFVPTPFTYQNTLNTFYRYVVDIDTALPYIRFIHYVDVSHNADGYGTLQLPGVTHTNTLRMKTVEVTYDSLMADTAGNGNYFLFNSPSVEQTTSYKWFRASNPSIVLTIDADSAGTMATQSSYLYNSFTTSIGETPASSGPIVNVFPNPANDRVNVILEKEGKLNHIFQLTDTRGRVIRETSLEGIQHYSFYVNNLESGVYLWKVTGLNEQGKLIVQ